MLFISNSAYRSKLHTLEASSIHAYMDTHRNIFLHMDIAIKSYDLTSLYHE